MQTGWTIPKYAAHLGVHVRTLERWCEQGRGPRIIINKGPAGRSVRRITAAEAERFERELRGDAGKGVV